MRILVSGGGTAGHISPILATVDALKSLNPDIELLYVGQSGSMENKIATAAKLKFAAISAGKFRRYKDRGLIRNLLDVSTIALNFRDMFRVARGFSQSLKIIKIFQPDMIFIKGGYVGLPVGLAARVLNVPYIIHESDLRAGLANRILAKRAQAIAVGFPVDKYTDLPPDKLVYTGIPTRAGLLKSHRLEGLAHFKLSDNLPVILIVGGSQGAHAINQVILAALPELTRRYQVLHLTGGRDIEWVKFESKRTKMEYPERYQAYSFLSDDYGMALAAADLAVVRGGSSIMELAIVGRPAIVIPHPSLGDQTLNATVLARAGAVKVITQDRLTPQSLLSQIEQILGSPDEQKYLTSALKQFAVPDADFRLAKLIIESVPAQEAK